MDSSDQAINKQTRLFQFAYASFLGTWSLGILFLIAKQFLLQKLLCYCQSGNVYINDFLHFYCAGLLVLSGQGAHVYDPQVQMQFMDRLIAPLNVSQVFYIQYVPFVFPLSVPLALMPESAAFLTWAVLSCLFIGLSLFLLHKYLPPKFEPAQTALIGLGLFSTLANFECLQLGQLGNLLLLLCSVYLISILSKSNFKRDFFGGICLALCSLKPHYALILAVPALALGRWRLLITAAIAELILLSIAAFSIGWENVINYPGIVIAADANPNYAGVHAEHMVSIRGILCHFLPEALSLKVSLFILLACAVLLLSAWLKARKNEAGSTGVSAEKNLLFAATVMTMAVFSPHTNIYDCVLLALPAYLLLPSLDLRQICGIEPFPLKCSCILLFFYPLLSALMFVVWEYIPLADQTPVPFFLYHLTILLLLCKSLFRVSKA